jgi:transcription antitermination protein NusB
MQKEIGRNDFLDLYFPEKEREVLDMAYLDMMERLIFEHEKTILGYIAKIAPKFEIQTLPLVHVLILMIALTEICYFTLEELPHSISVNEAIELAKTFSDTQGKNFINGALSTFLKDRELLLSTVKESTLTIFS